MGGWGGGRWEWSGRGSTRVRQAQLSFWSRAWPLPLPLPARLLCSACRVCVAVRASSGYPRRSFVFRARQLFSASSLIVPPASQPAFAAQLGPVAQLPPSSLARVSPTSPELSKCRCSLSRMRHAACAAHRPTTATQLTRAPAGRNFSNQPATPTRRAHVHRRRAAAALEGGPRPRRPGSGFDRSLGRARPDPRLVVAARAHRACARRRRRRRL